MYGDAQIVFPVYEPFIGPTLVESGVKYTLVVMHRVLWCNGTDVRVVPGIPDHAYPRKVVAGYKCDTCNVTIYGSTHADLVHGCMDSKPKPC